MSREEFKGYIDWDERKVYVDFGSGDEIPISIQYNVDEVARQILAGYWGNGEERFRRLAEAGYTELQIEEIQSRVNEMLGG